MNENRISRIKERLDAALKPTYCEVIDESHLHRGHAGARDGRGHYRVKIASPAFAGLSRLETHRLVYAAIGDLMTSDIHALAVDVRDCPEAS